MAKDAVPTRWAAGRFGRDTAIALARLIPAALHTAVGRQMDVQQVSRVKTLHPFGGTWPARYEELVAYLQDVPGVQVIKPAGRSFEVVLVNNVVLLPFEYAKDLRTRLDDRRVLRKLNKLALELLEEHGPEPTYLQPGLDGISVEGQTEVPGVGRPDLLRGLTPDGVVIVFYAADPRLGLLRVGWGEVAIGVGRAPVWMRTEELPLPASTPVSGPLAVPDVTQRSDQRVARFDDAPLPSPIINPRPAMETVSLGPVADDVAQEVSLVDGQG